MPYVADLVTVAGYTKAHLFPGKRSIVTDKTNDAGKSKADRICSLPWHSWKRSCSRRHGGSVWSSAADGVHCISPSDELLGKVLVPELVSIVCFGERHGSTLFITATTSVYAIALNWESARRPL